MAFCQKIEENKCLEIKDAQSHGQIAKEKDALTLIKSQNIFFFFFSFFCERIVRAFSTETINFSSIQRMTTPVTTSRIYLPPIASMLSNLPTLELSLPLLSTDDSDQNSDSKGNDRSIPYTIEDDIKILQGIHTYYGAKFNGKVPWSFWNVYITMTGTSRSSSSLYHHWNGSMKKKYKKYLGRSNLAECIKWLQSTIEEK